MQIANPVETETVLFPSEKNGCSTNVEGELENSTVESALDVTGKSLDLQIVHERRSSEDDDSIEGLYLYKNTFNLIPRSVGGLGKLKTLKFFGNEVNLFPCEFDKLVELERLQVKIPLPGLTGLPIHKLKSLRELELSKVPPRPSAFPLLGEIAGLRRLTKLSVCHFSIRYLPPEIGCLSCLEHLDLSHNKMRHLPKEISHLSALFTLKVANNKLVDLPSTFSSLCKLENLDLSSNRLISLGCLQLDSMHNLRRLSLQCNKLPSFTRIPSWIICDLEADTVDMPNQESASSSIEMDVLESTSENLHGSPTSLSSHLAGSSSNNKCFAARKPGKGWKRRYYLQRRARQERLNCSRKKKGEDSAHISTQKEVGCSDQCNSVPPASISEVSAVTCGCVVDSKVLAGEGDSVNSLASVEDITLGKVDADSCASIALQSVEVCKESKDDCSRHDDCTKHDPTLGSLSDATGAHDESLLLDISSGGVKFKRQSDMDLDSPKPRKSRRPIDRHLDLSSKYSTISYCSIAEHLPDGFYDAGRDRPFLPLRNYEENMNLGSREVIIMDRENDEALDAILLCAKGLLFRFNQNPGSTTDRGQGSLDNLQKASLLALFVSDHFGGSDRSAAIDKARKAASGSNYRKPFVCTCSTGNSESVTGSSEHKMNPAEDTVLLDLCEKSLHSIKAKQNSIIVPIGTVQFGVCRHRALLMKYLCDRMEPQVPCELVRGYLDFSPHAWNIIVVKRGDKLVRMIVDACRPHDIREERDPEYFCRYIPLTRINVLSMADGSTSICYSMPSLPSYEDIGETSYTTIRQYDFGGVKAVAKVRTLEASAHEVRNFELNCLGEVRILSALKHPCIVEVLGHQISTKWLPSQNGIAERRVVQSAIFLEHIKGGSLKQYIEKLAKTCQNNVPLELVLHITRDVASALSELHSKDIIHRDIKSENILIDLDTKKSDGSPVVKLCDFDRAVPLRSCLHTCCIGHTGIPPPNVCVGTPRWMAPEVFRTIHDQRTYGLEVDIWSFGCLLLELLTLRVPYSELPQSDIQDLLLMGRRPPLTDELEAFGSVEVLEDTDVAQSGTELQTAGCKSGKTLRFLVDIYRLCTNDDPRDRPTANKLYRMLADFSSCSSA